MNLVIVYEKTVRLTYLAYLYVKRPARSEEFEFNKPIRRSYDDVFYSKPIMKIVGYIAWLRHWCGAPQNHALLASCKACMQLRFIQMRDVSRVTGKPINIFFAILASVFR